LTGTFQEDSSAFEIRDFSRLTQSQSVVAVRVLQRIYEISANEANRERAEGGRYSRNQHTNRPRNVFLLDGPRGSGKTTLLLTIRHHAELMGDSQAWNDNSGVTDETQFLKRAREKIAQDLKEPDGTLRPQVQGQLKDLFQARHAAASGGARKTACSLKVLFPSDLDGEQPIMEGLFSLMDAQLADEIEARRRMAGDRGPVSNADLYDLRNVLYEDVAKGWYLSQREGDEAILRDSFDLDEYLNKRGVNSGRSYQRVAQWREFVNRFLDVMNSQTLIVCFDDTDVTPEVTEDMLHTIRIFLDHPRIITLVAGHLRSMRQTLVRTAIGSLRKPLSALSGPDGMTARAWRSFQRHQVEEFLEKILPRYQRYFLKMAEEPSAAPSAGSNGEAYAPNSDVSKFMGVGFDDFAQARLRDLRENFLQAKWRAHWNYLHWRAELPSKDSERRLDSYLAWWLFRHWYGDRLRPRTLRQLKVFQRFLEPSAAFANQTGQGPPLSSLMNNEQSKRLPVILFESPDNFRLVQEFDDSDSRVMDWLRHQNIQSSWRGKRFIEINGQHIPASAYSFAFLMYRVDLALMMPLREYAEAYIPPGMLPKHSGPNLIGQRPFYSPNQQPTAELRFGVNSVLRHSLTPSNCIYFNDVRAMPELAWHDGKDDNEWEALLTYSMEEKFFRERDGMLLRKNEAELSSEARAFRYLFEVVAPIASLEINDFVDPPSNLKTELDFLIDAERTNEMFGKARGAIESARRQFDYLDRLAKGGTGPEAVADEARGLLRNKWREFSDTIFYSNSGSGPLLDYRHLTARHMQQYRWLVNDVRRAFHAMRVYVSQSASVALPVRQDANGANAVNKYERRKPYVPQLDRYTIASVETITRFITHTEDCERVWIKWSLPFPNDDSSEATKERELLKDRLSNETAALIADLSDPDNEPLPLGKLIALELQRHDCNDLETYFSSVGRSKQGNGIDLSNPEFTLANLQKRVLENKGTTILAIDANHGRLRPKSSDPERADAHEGCGDESRIARYLLNLIWALGPCFPSLIHIDVAAEVNQASDREDLDEKTKNEIGRKLFDWETLVAKSTRFMRRYRAVAEVARLRMDLQVARLEGDPPMRLPKEFEFQENGVRLTLYPDASHTSLGVRGLQDRATRDAVAVHLNLTQNQVQRLKTYFGREGVAPRAEFRGILDSVEDHLQTARDFLKAMRHKFPEGSPQEPVPQTKAKGKRAAKPETSRA
jgi:hypothetical protein